MAKKDKKKGGKAKAGKKAAKGTSKSKSKSAGKKSLAPKAVKTGKGLSVLEVAQQLAARVNSGQWDLDKTLWSPKIESIEGMGVEQKWSGRKAVDAKNTWWSEAHIVHGGTAEGPFVGSTGFAMRYTLDVEEKATGKRQTMTEVAVYTIKNGKIVTEEFMYSLS